MTQDQPENNEIKKTRRTTAKAETKTTTKAAKSSKKAEATTEVTAENNAAETAKRTTRAPRASKKAAEATASESAATPAAEPKEAKRTVRRTPKKAEEASATGADTATEAAAPKTRRTTRKPAPQADETAGTATAAMTAVTSAPSVTSADKPEANISEAPKTPKTRGASRKKVDLTDAAPKAETKTETKAPAPAETPAMPHAVTPAMAPATAPVMAPVRPSASQADAPRKEEAPVAPVAPKSPATPPKPPRAIAAALSDDDGIVTHILPPLEERDDDSRRKRPRRRSRRKRKNEMQPFQPEVFSDIYPSAGLTSVLPLNEPFVFSDDDDFEDDGPQPALPNQPSLALPPALLLEDEEDLNALDEAINGNRVDGPGNRLDTPGESRFGKNRLAQGRGKRNRNERPERPDARVDARTDSRRPLDADKADMKPRPDGKPGKQGKFAKSAPVAPIAPVTPGIDPDLVDDVDLSDIVVPTGKRVLYVSVVPDEQVEVVITDNGLVTEYFVEMAHQAKVRGNIYKGVVNNVDTNLQAAFVNFGSGKNGFLQIDEIHPEYWLTHHDATKGPKYPPIQKVMKVGQEVLVQVVKEPAGTKGAFLTTWVSLAGRFLVLTPGQEQIGVSRKVEDPEERARLKELLAGIDPGEDMGVIIRTASEGASKTSIQKDLQYLKRLWKDIRKRVTTEKAPALLHQEADLASRAVRDYLAEDIIEIWVDDESTLGSIREMTSLLFPRRTDMVKLHQDPRQTLWERFNLQRQLEEVTSREVVLPSGGRLVFDQTEALMAIDINSGKTQGKSNFEAMVFRTNMEAAEAIARHLRLRDIGGQVVIDFIEMRDRNHCRDVEKALRNAMRLDRARHDVGRMSSFGLLELVRQRTGTSAISISSEPCPHCRGTGVRRNMEWQALQALRDLQAKLVKNAAQNQNGKNRKYDPDAAKLPFLHEVDFELGLYLLNRKRDRLMELESRYCVKIEIQLKS